VRQQAHCTSTHADASLSLREAPLSSSCSFFLVSDLAAPALAGPLQRTARSNGRVAVLRTPPCVPHRPAPRGAHRLRAARAAAFSSAFLLAAWASPAAQMEATRSTPEARAALQEARRPGGGCRALRWREITVEARPPAGLGQLTGLRGHLCAAHHPAAPPAEPRCALGAGFQQHHS
jgi:hypothetical protein